MNVLRQLVKVIVDEGDEKEIKEYHASELKFKPRKPKGRRGQDHGKDLSENELKELEKLEKQEGGKSKLDDD